MSSSLDDQAMKVIELFEAASSAIVESEVESPVAGYAIASIMPASGLDDSICATCGTSLNTDEPLADRVVEITRTQRRQEGLLTVTHTRDGTGVDFIFDRSGRQADSILQAQAFLNRLRAMRLFRSSHAAILLVWREGSSG